MLLQADLIVEGQELELNGSDAQSRLVRGFQQLLTRTYPHLRMLRGITYSENEIGRFLQPETTLYGSDAATFSEAEQEMLAFVNSNDKSGLRTTLQTLVSRFERKPYGWYLAAIQCILAKLCARGKIELLQDSNPLEEQALERAIRNTHGYSSVLLKPQIEFTGGQVRQLHDFYADFFDTPPQANEAKALGQATAEALRQRHQELTALRQQAAVYPFLTALDDPITRLEAISRQPYAFYLTDLRRQSDDLLDVKELVIDPILRFMRGAHKAIYDEASNFLRSQDANFNYVGAGEARELQQILENPRCYQGNQMQEAKRLLTSLQEQVKVQVAQEKATALAKIDERWERLTSTAEFSDLTQTQQADLEHPFGQLKIKVKSQSLIAVIRDLLTRFDEAEYQQQLRLLTQLSATNRQPQPTKAATTGQEPKVIEPRVEYVSQQNLPVAFSKAWLADEADVKAYVEALEKAMLAVIQDGKRIQI
jgi:hypothetical protein